MLSKKPRQRYKGFVENNAHWKTGERPDLNHKIKSNRDFDILHALESARHNCKFFSKMED